MIRLLLIVLLVGFLIIGGIAIALYHFFGWKGMLAFPFILLAMIWIAKFIIGKIFKKLALGLFGMKSGSLKDAAINVHSIKPVAKPVEPEDEEDEDEDTEEAAADGGESRPQDKAETDDDEHEEPKHYYEVDITITPKEGTKSLWEPTELMLATERITSLEDMEEKDAGNVLSAKVWDGNAFGPDDPGKYDGEQRLLLTFEVTPGVSQAWLQYYAEPLGMLHLPEWRL